VSLVGHNDMPLVERVQPPLTTVSIPQREIGAEAARILLARLGPEPVSDEVEHRLLPTRLVVRASTAPPHPE
jgi:LacI family transcriptional regulator